MWIVYYFYHYDGTSAGSYTFSGSSQQRRKAARALCKSIGVKAAYSIYKYRKGAPYTSGSFV